MRRVLLASLLGLGLLGATTTVPPKAVTAASRRSPVTVIVKGDDPYGLPETEIVAPEKPVKRGHNIVLRIKPLTDKPKGLVQSSYIWVISPQVDDLFTYPDNSQASFGSGDESDPSHYDVTLVANYVFIDADGKNPVLKTVEATASISVGSVHPVPPTPTPTPTPTPVPDGKYKLASFMVSAAKSLPSAEAATLASTLRGLSSKIAAGAYKSKAELVNDTATVCSGALGSSMKAWATPLDALATQMNTLGIITLPDCKTAYDEVATGLETLK